MNGTTEPDSMRHVIRRSAGNPPFERPRQRVCGTVRQWSLLCVAGGLLWLPSLASASAAEADLDFFENRIRPILVKRCDGCHSTEKGKTSGGLALDTRDGWMQGGDSGEVIVPGKPDDSLLIQAIRYEDGLQMPPEEKGGQLPDEEIALLVEWVRRGAPDPRTAAARIGGMSAEEARSWWAFQPVRAVEPPAVTNSQWPLNPIDQFIGQALEKQGLKPVGTADKRSLIRRATFDLTGLPPTPEDIAAFLADNSSDAFAKVVDRLLSQPEYGERWGRHWLDVARYADTAGDGADYPVREAVKYRDWVIRAFNRDLPYDEFVREQLAGDIIAAQGPPELYADRVIATGFWAIGKRYGYKPSPDFQHLDFADAIDSVGRSLLGLSLGCARCHDHKYDPVTAADYYAIYGILESSVWAFPGGEEQKRPSSFVPLVPADEVRRLEQAKADELAQVDSRISSLRDEQSRLDGRNWAGGPDLAFEGQAIGNPPTTPWLSVGPNKVLAEAQSPFAHIHPVGQRAVRVGSGNPGEGVRYVFERGLRAVPGRQMHFAIDFRTVSPTDKTGAYRFYLGRGVIASQALECSVTPNEFAIRNGAEWEVIRQLEPGTWYTLQLTLDPQSKKYSGVVGTLDDLTHFADKGLNPNWDGVADTFICDAHGHVPGTAPERDLDNIGLQETPFAAPGSTTIEPIVVTPEARERLAAIEAELKALTEQRNEIAARITYEVAYGVSEGMPVNTRIQKRGEPDKLGEEVPRRFLEILGSEPVPAESKGSGRWELAQWITRPTNPLTARVFVNRVWHWHFGQGLVATSSDFGSRGSAPTHPELLDWLAADFMQQGWSIKQLHRTIMLSQTYQLSSADDEQNLAQDPSNQWHWRFPRRVLDAESIRDAMLAVSGKLNRAVGPPHPFPPVDTWAYTIHNPFHAVYDSDHRSVYLMVQRNRRHPYLALFDGADPNLSVAERQPTTTPTQTLFLMNSPFVHDQSNAFAGRILASGDDTLTRLRWAFEVAHGQLPADSDLQAAEQFLATYTQQLADRGIPADQQPQAAWAALCRVLLTSNAFLYVD